MNMQYDQNEELDSDLVQENFMILENQPSCLSEPISIKTVFYVENLDTSKLFYTTVLDQSPILDAPELVEFQLMRNFKLGLVPLKGIVHTLNLAVRHRPEGCMPACEICLKHEDPEGCLVLFEAAGGKLIQPLKTMDWGEEVAYGLDPDGHMIAFSRA